MKIAIEKQHHLKVYQLDLSMLACQPKKDIHELRKLLPGCILRVADLHLPHVRLWVAARFGMGQEKGTLQSDRLHFPGVRRR